MIRRHLFALRLLLIGADVLVAAALFLGLGQLRFGDAAWTTLWHALGVNPVQGGALYAVAWVTMLWFLGLYAFRSRWTIGSELNEILVAAITLLFATMSFLYLVKLDVSRLFLLAVLVAQPLVTIGSRIAMRLFFNWLRTRGYNRCFMVVVGTGEDAQAFADAIERHRELGIRVIGHLRAPDQTGTAVTRPILGEAEDLARLFHERVVDEVALCAGDGAHSAAWARPIIRLAADEGKHVRVPTAVQARPFDLQTEELDGLLIRSYVHGPARLLSLAVKRLVDVAGSLVGLVLLSPLLVVVALAIIMREGRPVLFHQTRVGLHGRQFTIHKFRTMTADAEARYAEVEHLSDTKGAAFKLVSDPRVTRLGSFLRKTSIDELPQLWNVLVGEMSLIGPRPAPPREVDQYDMWHRRRLSMKPGITGLWQVSQRLDRHFDERAKLDMDYIDGWSLGLDLRILLMTVPAVVGRTGR